MEELLHQFYAKYLGTLFELLGYRWVFLQSLSKRQVKKGPQTICCHPWYFADRIFLTQPITKPLFIRKDVSDEGWYETVALTGAS